MLVSAQAIIMGRLSPRTNCALIDPITFEVKLTPTETGWGSCSFGFALNRDQLHVVVDFVHEDTIDRAHAVGKMRRTVRNLVDWFLLGETLFSDSALSFGPDQAIVRYDGDKQWTSHGDPLPATAQTPPAPTTQDIFKGGSILPFVTRDALLLYALQDYASAVANPEFSLFLLWRSVEWILWDYDASGSGRNPSFAPAEKALSLPKGWLSEIGDLAHNYARHARHRENPDPRRVAAARDRVKALLLRHLRATHKYPDATLPALEPDALSGWAAP